MTNPSNDPVFRYLVWNLADPTITAVIEAIGPTTAARVFVALTANVEALADLRCEPLRVRVGVVLADGRKAPDTRTILLSMEDLP
jgi:hypothetical protein